jgi:dienelactone hydrolase
MALRNCLASTFLAGMVFAAGLAAPPPAHAQMWLAPADPAQTVLGPTRARGAVIWSHGRSVNSEDSTAPTPPYMAQLHDGGWDTFRFNRMRTSDTLAASAAELAQVVRRLKAQGYQQVALAGQSFGAFLALMAADASEQVDAVVATAPAAYGSFGEFYDSWRNNATRLYPLLDQVKRARVMVFYFHGDDFDPGGRGERSRDILSRRGIENVVVDQPPQLTTHWAASTSLFVKKYGGCILGFLDAARIAEGAHCQDDTFWAGSPDAAPAASSGPGASLAADQTQRVAAHP